MAPVRSRTGWKKKRERERERDRRDREKKETSLTGKPCPPCLCQLSLRVVNLTVDREKSTVLPSAYGRPGLRVGRGVPTRANRAVIFMPFLRRFLAFPRAVSHRRAFLLPRFSFHAPTVARDVSSRSRKDSARVPIRISSSPRGLNRRRREGLFTRRTASNRVGSSKSAKTFSVTIFSTYVTFVSMIIHCFFRDGSPMIPFKSVRYLKRWSSTIRRYPMRNT